MNGIFYSPNMLQLSKKPKVTMGFGGNNMQEYNEYLNKINNCIKTPQKRGYLFFRPQGLWSHELIKVRLDHTIIDLPVFIRLPPEITIPYLKLAIFLRLRLKKVLKAVMLLYFKFLLLEKMNMLKSFQ